MRKRPTYIQELVPFIIMGTIIGTLVIAIGYGIITSFIQIEIASNLEIIGLAFGLSFIIFHILFILGKYLLKKDEIADLKKKNASLEERIRLEKLIREKEMKNSRS